MLKGITKKVKVETGRYIILFIVSFSSTFHQSEEIKAFNNGSQNSQETDIGPSLWHEVSSNVSV